MATLPLYLRNGFMLDAVVGHRCSHCAFEAEAGTEECTCPLPEDQGALSFWTIRVHSVGLASWQAD